MTILSDLTFLTKQLWMFRAWFSFIAWSHFWQTRSLFLAQFYTSRFTTAQSSCFLLAQCPLVSPWYLVTEFRSTILSPRWLLCCKIVTCKVEKLIESCLICLDMSKCVFPAFALFLKQTNKLMNLQTFKLIGMLSHDLCCSLSFKQVAYWKLKFEL